MTIQVVMLLCNKSGLKKTPELFNSGWNGTESFERGYAMWKKLPTDKGFAGIVLSWRLLILVAVRNSCEFYPSH